MAFKDERWIAQAAWAILNCYSSNKPAMPEMTGEEYAQAYAYMDRVLACVNACAGIDVADLKNMHVKDSMEKLSALKSQEPTP